jgi:hypothetical protein
LQSRTNTSVTYGKDFSSSLQYLEIFLKFIYQNIK